MIQGLFLGLAFGAGAVTATGLGMIAAAALHFRRERRRDRAMMQKTLDGEADQ